MENRNPLRVYCKNCGAPAGFNILQQTYRCPSCGEITGIQEAQKSVYEWRELQKKNTEARFDGQQLEEHDCPSCGARLIFNPGEVSETCDFCGSRLVRRELTDPGQMPELIIPFFITPEEARKRLLDWGHSHEDTPEGRSVVSSMNRFHGCYMPYQIVRGPVRGMVTREGNNRKYQCAGYLKGTAVSTSSQLDNLVLNEMEPFDWSAARPFGYGYIAGQNVKLSDISDAQTDTRIREEIAGDFLPEVEKVMQSTGVKVETETGDMYAVSALLPVYFIKSGKLTAVMNGQTGRIAVSKERKKETTPWIWEPLLYTIIATLAAGIFFRFELVPLFLSGFVLASLFFAIMGEGRNSLVRRITLRTQAAKARRENGELKIDEEKDILKNPYDNTPVFYEKNREGTLIPVKIRFYTPGRWLSILKNTFLMVFLPGILAAFIRWVEMNPGEVFGDGYHPQNGAAWYVLTGLLAILYLAKGVRRDVYDHPILYEIRQDGRTRRMGRRADRKIGILSMFGIGKREKDGKKLTLFGMLRSMGGMGIFLAAVVLIILFGSTAAILVSS